MGKRDDFSFSRPKKGGRKNKTRGIHQPKTRRINAHADEADMWHNYEIVIHL